MAKKYDEEFKNFTKCGIFNNVYVGFDVKVRDGTVEALPIKIVISSLN